MGEEEVGGSDFAFALMLLMSITFQMTIFYLVNWPDIDIRTYSWDIIGNTILIFTGVLIFAACDGWTDHFLVDTFPRQKGMIQLLQLVFWYAVLQFVSAFSSGLFHKSGADFSRINVKTMQIERCGKPEGLKERKRNAECFCSLLGHITAFAAIHCFGFLQDETRLGDTVFGAYCVSWIALGGLCLLFTLAGYFRNYIVRYYPGKEECIDNWQEITADKENDICGLACSFLAFLAFRFYLVGKLPSIEGTVVASPDQVPSLIPEIFFAGLSFVAAGAALLWFELGSGWVDSEDEMAPLSRMTNIGQNFCNMSVSWAALLNVNLFIRYMGWFVSCEVIPARIMIAFFISYGVFLCIWVLDKLDDRLKEKNIPSSWMSNIITALGLAVGFAWEQSFDTAVDDVSDTLQEHFGMPASTLVWLKLGGALLLVAVVLPAFRLHIQPIVEEADEAKEAADQEIMRRVTKSFGDTGAVLESAPVVNDKPVRNEADNNPVDSLKQRLLTIEARLGDLESS